MPDKAFVVTAVVPTAPAVVGGWLTQGNTCLCVYVGNQGADGVVIGRYNDVKEDKALTGVRIDPKGEVTIQTICPDGKPKITKIPAEFLAMELDQMVDRLAAVAALKG